MLSTLLFLSLALGDGDLIEDFEDSGAEPWERVVSDAHPPYNVIERLHDPGRAKSGEQYLHLRTMGGRTAIRRSARHPWPVDPDRPYRATVWVRLAGTRQNAASISLTWTGASGEVLAVEQSRPLLEAKDWTPLVFEVPRSPAGAAGVLPALHFDGPDVRGSCDFDRLVVAAVERLDLAPAGRALPIYTTQEYPRFTLTPSGLPPGLHAITVTMTSSEGGVVKRSATIEVPGARSVAIDFPPAAPGISHVDASVDGGSARKSVEVLVTPPGLLSAEDPVFERSAGPAAAPPEAALLRRILRPGDAMTIDDRFFSDAGAPTSVYYGLRLVDSVLAGAEPIADPGLFPASVHAAAFRKGPSALFALWSEGNPVELAFPFDQGRLLALPLASPKELRPGEKIRIGPTPSFLLDVDPVLAEVGIELSATRIPFQLDPSHLTLRVRNRSLGGSLRDLAVTLTELPAGWRASTRAFRAAELAPGSVRELSLDLLVPATESERDVLLPLAVSFTAAGRERRILATRLLSLASALRIESTISPERMLGVQVQNASDHSVTLWVRSRIPGLTERLDLIRDLGPGSRSRVFEVPAEQAGAAEVFIREVGGGRGLSRREIRVP